ncbi:MAG: lysophospholipid acyltransferase family protein [Actinomycetota bacterium]|nr:lysophospholipid acyltransferase family protein [Actinomycetota bacterium]
MGNENVPSQGPVIFVANHVTAIDPFVVAVALSKRKLSSIAKEELFRSPILAAFLTRIGVFPVSRGKYDRKILKRSLEILLGGGALALFPEGTRYRLGEGELGPLQDGAALISIMSAAPIIPLAITGTDKAILQGAKFICPAKVRVKIGRVVTRSDDRKEYTANIRKALIHLLNQAAHED